MELVDKEDLLEWIDKAELTPDGGIDINDLKEKLETMPVLMNYAEYVFAKEMLNSLAKGLHEKLLGVSDSITSK